MARLRQGTLSQSGTVRKATASGLRLGRLRQPSALLSVAADGALPEEFPIFVAGANATQFGDYILDPADLASVMEAFQVEGVDLMVDLEHDSIDEEKRAARADAADALGWFVPVATPDGGIVGRVASWCPEGARRLRARTQRYISPVFEYDEGGHIKRLVNVALVARPATHNAAPLVAARKREARKMNPELLKKIMEAMTGGDKDAALELLKDIIASAAGAAPSDAPSDDNALAENAAAPVEPAAPAVDPAAKEDKEMANALRQVTCRQSAGEAIAVLRQMAVNVKTLMDDRARVDMGSRIELVGDLVKLGAETPATAWEGEPESLLPVARLRSEPVESLRNRVAILRNGRGDDVPIQRPTAALSAADQKRADSITDPVHRERFIARRLGRN